MNKRPSHFFFFTAGIYFVTALASGAVAHAEILFLNLNAAQHEVASAQAAAKKIGQKLIVIPSLDKSPQDTQKILALQAKVAQLERAVEAHPNESSELRDELTLKRIELGDLKNQFAFTVEKLKAELDSLNQTGLKVDSVVISGHSNGLDFDGKNGYLERGILLKALGDTQQTQNLKSLYLWGCNTGKAANINFWNKAFPAVDLLVGMKGSGPADGSGAPALGSLIEKEGQIRTAHDTKQIAEILRSAENFSRTVGAILIRECFIEANTGNATPLKNILKDCSLAIPALKKLQGTYFSPYFKPTYYESDFPNPVQETYDLNTFYGALQDSAHCLNLPDAAKIPSINATIAMRHFSIVVESYKKYYSSELRRVNQLLKSETPCRPFEINAPTSRKRILSDFENTEKCFNVLMKYTEDSKLQQLQPEIQSFFQKTRCTLIKMDGTPLGWNLEDSFDPSLDKNHPACD